MKEVNEWMGGSICCSKVNLIANNIIKVINPWAMGTVASVSVAAEGCVCPASKREKESI